MKYVILNYPKTLTLVIVFGCLCASGVSQNFFIIANMGGGQATGEYDSRMFAITTGIGVGYQTKSEIITLSATIKTESFNFYEESDIMVFSLPLSCEIHPRTNPKPYFGVSIAPSYPTQWLIARYFFLTGGLHGGISYDFKRLTPFAQFEYLADLTGYSRTDDFLPASQVDKYYLYRYYVTLGVKVRL